MHTYCYALPLPDGKADELRSFGQQVTGPRKAEHDEYMRRYHLTKEYAWIQPSPMGDWGIVYLESTADFMEVNREFAMSSHPFDVWFRQTASQVFGQDFSRPLSPDFVRVLIETTESWATGSETPIAYAVPIQAGKTEQYMRLVEEVRTTRAAEAQEARRRYMVGEENWYLEHTPQGDVSLYYVEVADAASYSQSYAMSRDPFDVWQKQMLMDITGLDFNQPPSPEQPQTETVLMMKMPRAAAA